MKTLKVITIVFVSLGLIIAAVPEDTTHPYKLSAEELLIEANSKAQYFSPEEVADLLIQKDPSIQLIDVRDQDEYEKFSLPGSINIPLTNLLAEEWRDFIDQDIRMNIFYSNGTVKANEAWIITRQLGYKNNYVLEGGLNYWAEVIMNPSAPESTSPDEEFARYDFRRGAGMALGSGEMQALSSTSSKPKPVIATRPKKERAAGGC